MAIRCWQELLVLYGPPFPATFLACTACQITWGNAPIVYAVLGVSWVAIAWGLVVLFRKMNEVERSLDENIL